MADAYLTIAEIAADEHMIERVTACAAQQAQAGHPIGFAPQWAREHAYVWASSPTWGEKWDYANATHDDPDYEPGTDAAVITDGDILATVQALAPIPEELMARTIPYDAPHFAFPFQRGEHGKVNLVEQATPEHVQGQMLAVAVTPMGYRDARPDFGWEWPEFRSVPLDVSALAEAFYRLVPDQAFNLAEWPDVVSEAIRHISVTPVLSGQGSGGEE